MANYLKDLPDDFNPGPLDLDQPLDNQVALLKLQADLSGADVQGGLFNVSTRIFIRKFALARRRDTG